MIKNSFYTLLSVLTTSAAMCTFVGGAFAADSTTVITESEIVRQAEDTTPTGQWVLYTRLGGNAAFRSGPDAPPSGLGSLEFSTPTSADKVTLFNYEHIFTPLSDIDALGYSTYRSAGSALQVASLNLQVDVNGAAPGGFTTLVFEPVYNTGQGAVTSGVWQTWDAFSEGQAIWWSSNSIPGAPNRDTFVTWETILAANPNAVIVGGVGINQGSGNAELITAADLFSIGHASNIFNYDFEPYLVAGNKNQCKSNGWVTRKRADGTPFSSQGDCVSYTVNGQ